jgi:transcriptional regulator with XRE-family HTH domain
MGMSAEKRPVERSPKLSAPGPDELDRHIGMRLRERRVALGMTQSELGDQLGVSFQQLQKYEGGVNSFSPWGLWRVANCLGVPVSYFFEGLEDHSAGEFDLDRSALILTRSIRKLSPKLRERLGALVAALITDDKA